MVSCELLNGELARAEISFHHIVYHVHRAPGLYQLSIEFAGESIRIKAVEAQLTADYSLLNFR
jgi:hypothetical protein